MHPADIQPNASVDHGSLAGPRKALAGFFVSGVLLAFMGAILPSWGHHLLSDYWMVGVYFVALLAGLMAASRIAPWLLMRKGIGETLAISCAAASVSLLILAFFSLAFFSPPFAAWCRLSGIALFGMRGGRPAYRDLSRHFAGVPARSGGDGEPGRRCSAWVALRWHC